MVTIKRVYEFAGQKTEYALWSSVLQMLKSLLLES